MNKDRFGWKGGDIVVSSPALTKALRGPRDADGDGFVDDGKPTMRPRLGRTRAAHALLTGTGVGTPNGLDL